MLQDKTKTTWKKTWRLFLMQFLVLTGWAAVTVIELPAPDFKRSTYLSSKDSLQAELSVLQYELFIQKDIEPLLNEAARRNQQSLDNVFVELEFVFQDYKGRVEPFVDDLASYGTRFRILRMMPGEWRHDDGRIEEMVTGMFEGHLFTEDELVQDITLILLRFAEEIQAIENWLLIECRAAVAASDMPEIFMPAAGVFAAEVMETLGDFAENRARGSVYNGIATLIAGEAAAVVSVGIVKKVSTGFGTKVAPFASQAVSGAAAGAAVGASAGSILPGKGTVIGLGAGLVMGITVDWWMTEQFKEKLCDELKGYIESLLDAVLHGSDEEPGLQETLQVFVDDYKAAQRSALKLAIMEVH